MKCQAGSQLNYLAVVNGLEINMSRTDFIKVEIIARLPESSVQFINKKHITRIYTENDIVCIEMNDYTVFKLQSENILTLMDRLLD